MNDDRKRTFTDGLSPPKEEKPVRVVTAPKKKRKAALDAFEKMESARKKRENALTEVQTGVE
jgi:hypothetical protein